MQENINVDAVKDGYGKLVKLYSDQAGINADIKAVKEALKNEGVDASAVAKLAKAFVKDNKDKVKDDAEALVELCEMLS